MSAYREGGNSTQLVHGEKTFVKAHFSLSGPPQCHGELLTDTALSNPPHSLRVAARLDHGEGLRPAPVPEVELVVGGYQQELRGRVEGQRSDGHVALREPTLAAALKGRTRRVSYTRGTRETGDSTPRCTLERIRR